MQPVIPGHFSGRQYGNSEAFFNVRLRIGEVQQVFYPEDPQNVSKKFVEYQVWVQHRTNGTAVTKIYDHCLAIDHFGSVADFSFATYRADPSATRKNEAKSLRPGLGAMVVILCINGESTQGLILGGVRNGQSTELDSKDDGHHLHSRFNGVDVEVNDDGELTITYGGATKLDGTNTDDVDVDSIGTFVTFSKDGNVLLSDKDGDNTILLDHANDQVVLQSDNEVNVSADTVKVSGESEVDVEAPDVSVTASDSVTVQSPSVTIGEGAQEPPLKAVTFNAALATFMTALSAYTAAMEAVDPSGGIATAAIQTAIGVFTAAAAEAGALTVTVA
jgi:phage baseplate assembly protein gpV